MSKIFRGRGEALNVVAAGALTSGDVVITGTLVGIAASDAATGDDVAVDIFGEFELPCVSADDIDVGDALYWNGSALTLTATANTFAGRAHSVAGVGVTTVICFLNRGA